MSELPANPGSWNGQRGRLAEGSRVAAIATLLTLLLVAAKGLFGHIRQSPGLTADAVHSGADALAIFASWVGLKLADRPPTRRFPFGLYRAETLAAVVASAVIIFAGIQLLLSSVPELIRGEEVLPHSWEVLAVALASSVLSFWICVWEKRVGNRLNSQSLLANADESRADIFTSMAVFVGTGASYLGIGRVELAVATGLSLLIIWLGLKHGRLGVYALLDASLDPELEHRAMSVAEEVPGVLKVEQVRLRRAGPFRFGIAHVQVRRATDVGRAHEVAHKVVSAVREAIPQIEMLTVHAEPYLPRVRTVMVPTEGDELDATVSGHFGRSKYFLFAEVSDEGVKKSDCVENPFRREPVRVGLTVIKEMLKERRVDAVLTQQMGEIAFHALRDYYVDICAAPKGTARQALNQFARGELTALVKPTHPSEAAGRLENHEEHGSQPA